MWVFGGNILKVFKSIGKNSVLVKTMTEFESPESGNGYKSRSFRVEKKWL